MMTIPNRASNAGPSAPSEPEWKEHLVACADYAEQAWATLQEAIPCSDPRGLMRRCERELKRALEQLADAENAYDATLAENEPPEVDE